MEQLEAVYHATTYRVFSPPIAIRTGAISDALDLLLSQHNVTHWAFISAWNPFSAPTSAADNDIAHEQLLAAVAAYPHFEGAGVGDDGLWISNSDISII